MANAFFMSQAQPLDYRATVAGAGAPVAGLMGGVQQGLQMAQTMQQMRQAEAEQQAAQQAAVLEQQQQALKMQGLQQQQDIQQQEFELKQQEAQREAVGSLGTLLVSGSKSMSRSTYERAVSRIRKEGDSETEVGLPTRDQAAKMNDDELYSAMQKTGRQLEDYGMGAEAASKRRAKQKEFAAEMELKETESQRKAKSAADKGKLESVVKAIESPEKGRKEFSGLSKEFIISKSAYDRVIASAEDPSAAGDMALIFNYMKVLDPGSTVREGEFATAQQAGNIPQTIIGQYNKLIKGEGRLSEKLRNDFVDRSGRLFGAKVKSHKKLEEQFSRLAEKSGIAPEDVVLDYLGDLRGETAAVTGAASEMSDEDLLKMLQGAQ